MENPANVPPTVEAHREARKQADALAALRAENAALRARVTALTTGDGPTDPLTYANKLMQWPDPPPFDNRWAVKVCAAAEMVAARDREVLALRKRLEQAAAELAAWQDQGGDDPRLSGLAQVLGPELSALRGEREQARKALEAARAAGEYIYTWLCPRCGHQNETPEGDSFSAMCGHCRVHADYAEITTIDRVQQLLAERAAQAADKAGA